MRDPPDLCLWLSLGTSCHGVLGPTVCYGPDPVGIVKQPTYLCTTGHVRVGYAERAHPNDYIGPPHVWVEFLEKVERGRSDNNNDPVCLTAKGSSQVGFCST